MNQVGLPISDRDICSYIPNTGGPIVFGTPGEGRAESMRTHPQWDINSFLGSLLRLPDQHLCHGPHWYAGNLYEVAQLTPAVAQETNGATVLLEHRFYRFSNPYPDLTTKSLRVHIIQQAIEDLVYFARNVVLPTLSGGELTPDKAPWVLVGGSYSGTLLLRLDNSHANSRQVHWLAGQWGRTSFSSASFPKSGSDFLVNRMCLLRHTRPLQ